ncbi:hypothetical protein OAU50_02080 [Planctomycetota bacterium]|nr:hypothetical protein [Planctomycetota bacterium]
MKIPTPSAKQVSIYLKRWQKLENYVLQESSIRKLFTTTYPKNVDMDDVLIKVCALNDFYSTNIYSPFKVARHIVDLEIDERLKLGDLELVNEVALVKINRSKTINFYSFATKYCSHHAPVVYPIYDSFVEKLLMHFKRIDRFHDFRKADLRQYPAYREVLTKFSQFYGLEKYSMKQIDQYLWQAGKKHFPRVY